jgi:phage tail tape-measure protein
MRKRMVRRAAWIPSIHDIAASPDVGEVAFLLGRGLTYSDNKRQTGMYKMSGHQDKDPIEDWGEELSKAFGDAGRTIKSTVQTVGRELGETFTDAGRELKLAAKEAADDLRDGINAGRNAAAKGYHYVEETVGKDRLAGSAVGAKLGGLWGAKAGWHGIGVGAVVGGVVGFAAGRRIFTWLDKGHVNDNPEPGEDMAPPAPPSKPGDPAP